MKNKIKIIFLGTNGWYDTKTGNTICTLIETNDHFIILDAGSGFYKIEKYIKKEKPIYLFLSHFHLEHIIGLHILNKFNFKQGIRIYGQKGTKDILNMIINKPFTVPFTELPFGVKIYELPEGIDKIPFSVKSKFLLHSSSCLRYRFELEGKIISYCTDTGVCENLRGLAKNADLLITECSLKPGQHNEKWPHLNPEEAAKIAKKAKVKKLALTHFDANNYKTLKERKEAQQIARTIFLNTIVAMDNMQIKI